MHRVIEFHQSAIFEPYISFNSRQRAAATSEFEKDYFKLKNNSLFGKTMENVRNRMNFRLVQAPRELEKLSSRAEFWNSIIFTEKLVGVQLCQENVCLLL